MFRSTLNKTSSSIFSNFLSNSSRQVRFASCLSKKSFVMEEGFPEQVTKKVQDAFSDILDTVKMPPSHNYTVKFWLILEEELQTAAKQNDSDALRLLDTFKRFKTSTDKVLELSGVPLDPLWVSKTRKNHYPTTVYSNAAIAYLMWYEALKDPAIRDLFIVDSNEYSWWLPPHTDQLCTRDPKVDLFSLTWIQSNGTVKTFILDADLIYDSLSQKSKGILSRDIFIFNNPWSRDSGLPFAIFYTQGDKRYINFDCDVSWLTWKRSTEVPEEDIQKSLNELLSVTHKMYSEDKSHNSYLKRWTSAFVKNHEVLHGREATHTERVLARSYYTEKKDRDR